MLDVFNICVDNEDPNRYIESFSNPSKFKFRIQNSNLIQQVKIFSILDYWPRIFFQIWIIFSTITDYLKMEKIFQKKKLVLNLKKEKQFQNRRFLFPKIMIVHREFFFFINKIMIYLIF